MRADQLFTPNTVPEWATAEWYAGRESAPHLEQDLHMRRLAVTRAFALRTLETDVALVCDLGAGDGGLLSTLPRSVPAWGYDLQQTNVDVARDSRHVDVRLLDFVADQDQVEWGDLVIMTEVLEHLVDPVATLRAARAGGADFLIASSPFTETAESHYEFHLWAWDVEGYEAMLTRGGWQVVDRVLTDMFQVVLCTLTPGE